MNSFVLQTHLCDLYYPVSNIDVIDELINSNSLQS